MCVMFSSYDDFPLPVGPNMAFSPGLMTPLDKITQNYNTQDSDWMSLILFARHFSFA